MTDCLPIIANWLERSVKDPSRLQLTVHVQPGAKVTSCAGIHGEALKIRLAAPPVDGKANKALIIWLSKTLGCPQNAIEIVRGQNSRRKTLFVETGNNGESITRALQSLAANSSSALEDQLATR